MMTMTTSMADPITTRGSPNQLTSYKSSFILKESTDASPSIRCSVNECSTSPNGLRKIPTRIFQATNATAVVDLLDDDDDDVFDETTSEDTTLSSTFLQDWEAFCTKVKKSTTYALAHSSTTSPLPSPIADDDDQPMNDDTSPTNNSFTDSQCRLNRSAQALEEVNKQFAQLLDHLDSLTPYQPTLHESVNHLLPPPPCPEPQRHGSPQHVMMRAPPPAPNLPANTTQSPAHHLASQFEQTTAPGTTSIAHLPAPTIIPCNFPRPSTKKTTIPNWAKPAVPPPVPNLTAGMFGMKKTNWPLPRLDRKTILFKKKPATKPIAATRKDSLRPP